MVTIRITLMDKPSGGLPEEIDWMCRVMGLGRIDSIGTSKDIFEKLLHSMREGRAIGGSQLSQEIGVSRGSVLNLLERMMDSGIVRREGTGYMLRSKSMLDTVRELEVEVQRVFHRLEETAREVDANMGFEGD
jgi:DNA-binding Lrp family transcriptional regulator